MANAFTNLGARPLNMPSWLGGNFNVQDTLNKVSTPQAKALNNASTNWVTNPEAPKPSTALKSVTLPDGTKNEYHAPDTSGNKPATSQDQSNLIAGLIKTGVISPDKASASYTALGLVDPNAKPVVPENNQPAPTNYTTTNPANFGNMINTGANVSGQAANTGSANYNTANQGLINSLGQNQVLSQRAQDIANTAGQKISDIGGQGARGEAGYLTTGTSPVGEGNAAVLAQTTAAQQQAVAQGANMQLAGTQQGLTAQNQTQTGYNQASGNALTGQGQGISGLTNTAGLVSPTQVPYNTQYVDPLTGKIVGGGGTSGSLNDSLNSVITGLKKGTMSYADAQGALSGYGQGGLNALTKWATDNNFNIAQSNTLAGTQGTIKPAFDYANLAMDNLKNSFAALSVPGQSSNIQPIADVSNWFSNLSGIGKEAVRTKEGALAEARSAIQKVLASIQGGTPTDYTGQSHALLPDNATPADVDAAKANLAKLGQGKVDIYGNPGQSNNTTISSGNTISTNYGDINPNL